ncbi:MAG TPA: CoA transferase, partial [Dehalococcoidia bacterium]|nr:CoA transferase [Dehalococcoidia bacterium]
FACQDGYFVLAVAGDVMWQRLCKLLDRPDLFADESLKTGTGRAARAPFLRGIVEDWARDKTRLEVVDYLIKAGIPAGPVQDLGDLMDCPHLTARGLIRQVDDPVAGPWPVMSVPIRLSESGPPKADPPPQFGEHTTEILTQELGLAAEEIRRLRETGVIGGG